MDAKNVSGQAQAVSEQSDQGFVETSVEFPSCGEILRGTLLTPTNGTAPFPAIVMAPGMSGVKEGSIMQYATFFAQSGFAVLAFDNINFGESGGTPRQEADPILQRRGYRDAITFMTLRPEIAESKIGIFGTSYSGGHVLEVAAHDRRVKCVVSQIPAISGQEAFRRAVRGDLRGAALKLQDDDRKERFLGGPAAVIKSVSDNPADICVMPGAAAYEYFMAQGQIAPNWRNEVTLRSLDFYRGLDTRPYLPYISPTPLLMVVAVDDELASPDLALKAFSTALEPKKLVLLPGNHFAPYVQEFALTSTSARDWFVTHLVVGGSGALN